MDDFAEALEDYTSDTEEPVNSHFDAEVPATPRTDAKRVKPPSVPLRCRSGDLMDDFAEALEDYTSDTEESVNSHFDAEVPATPRTDAKRVKLPSVPLRFRSGDLMDDFAEALEDCTSDTEEPVNGHFDAEVPATPRTDAKRVKAPSPPVRSRSGNLMDIPTTAFADEEPSESHFHAEEPATPRTEAKRARPPSAPVRSRSGDQMNAIARCLDDDDDDCDSEAGSDSREHRVSATV